MTHQIPTERRIASGHGFEVKEFTCYAGPQDRPFEETHDVFTVAAVMAGSFVYQTDGGRRLMHPGSLLLGNAGACYQCGHDHSTGDRCVSFRFWPEYFEEVAAAAAGSTRFRFPAGALPAIDDLIPVLARVEAVGDGAAAGALELEELAVTVVEKVLAVASGAPEELGSAVTARDERRISEVLHHLEEHFDQPLQLEELAQRSGLSKYHFLRTFRGVVGRSPYQYVLALRMRRAALELLRTDRAVSQIAFDVGFGDLSTFNHRFRDVFGKTPVAFRQQYRRRPAELAAL